MLELKDGWRRYALLGLALVAAYAASALSMRYVGFDNGSLPYAILFALVVLAARHLSAHAETNRGDRISFGVFSLVFAVFVVLGHHIVIDTSVEGYGSLYWATTDMLYIAPYGVLDVFAYLSAAGVTYILSTAVFTLLKRVKAGGLLAKRGIRFDAAARVSAKRWAAFAALMFVLWLPYLLAWWPGFVFGDTGESLKQIYGMQVLNNHHPVLYTLFIKVCIWVAALFGKGATVGCALYCVIQMAFMATVFGYLFAWICARLNLAWWVGFALSVVFGMTSYIGAFSIAMWKDPIFTAAFLGITVMLVDYRCRGGEVRARWVCVWALLVLAGMFLRNNGMFAVVALLACLVFIRVATRKKAGFSACGQNAVIAVTAACLAVYLVVTGPVFSLMGAESSPKVESYGILLNQMGRVAATGGEMDEEEAAYLDALLPLEEYAEVYHPACVDPLKWDEDFDSEALGDDFFSTWFSLFTKNPATYFEAWELQTFGYWSVSHSQYLTTMVTNIAAGVPYVSADGEPNETILEMFDIYTDNFLGQDARAYYPMDEPNLPIGPVMWATLFVAICLWRLGRRGWLLSLVPVAVLYATLLVATPFAYWPRYIALLQFSIPLYAALLAGAVTSDADGEAAPMPTGAHFPAGRQGSGARA